MLTLQKGKHYKTRAGDNITVLEVRKGNFYYPAAVLHPKHAKVLWYRLNGETDITGEITAWDMIAEEVEIS